MRTQRHEHISRLVHKRSISNQHELQDQLARAGFKVTQATLSRDLRELGVLKSSQGYVLPTGLNGTHQAPNVEALARAVRRELRSIDHAMNLVVIRTAAGHANSLAVEIDRARLPESIGTVAGDDTILLIAKSMSAAGKLVRRLRKLASST